MTWHVLDVGPPWLKEFASALNRLEPTLGWIGMFSWVGMWRRAESAVTLSDPPLRVRYFPLQRGYARPVVRSVASEGARIYSRIIKQSSEPSESVLVCSTPFYVPIAERWPGPRIYYITDLASAHETIGRDHILELEARMCTAVDLVCPNSRRIAEVLKTEAGCPIEKITIIPNATRQASLLARPATAPSELPPQTPSLPRPIAGVIGNLASNMDWVLLRAVIRKTRWLSWLFVGPSEMAVDEGEQRQAREELLGMGGRVCFVGSKHYGDLKYYARALDVAVLPYRMREPTFSGSSTRFYEHQAACRPILATPAFEELLHKEPALRIVSTADEMAGALESLRANSFQDGNEQLRWKASLLETWEERAASMRTALAQHRSVKVLRATSGALQ